MINSVKFAPTIFAITTDARKVISKNNDNELLNLGLEALRNRAISPNHAKEGFLQSIRNFFKSRTQLMVVLDVNKEGNFVVNTLRSLNNRVFKGKEVPVDITKFVYDNKTIDKAILESKLGILEKINKLQNYMKG